MIRLSNLRWFNSRVLAMSVLALLVITGEANAWTDPIPPSFIDLDNNGQLSWAPNSTDTVRIKVNFHDYGPLSVKITSVDGATTYGSSSTWTSQILNGTTLYYYADVKISPTSFINATVTATGYRSDPTNPEKEVTLTGIDSP